MRAVYAYDIAEMERWFAEQAGHLSCDGARAASLAFEHQGVIRGYACYTWTPIPKVMQMVIACEPAYRGRWTRSNIGDVHRFPYLLGASTLVSVASSESIGRSLAFMGWERRASGEYWTPLPNAWSRYADDTGFQCSR